MKQSPDTMKRASEPGPYWLASEFPHRYRDADGRFVSREVVAAWCREHGHRWDKPDLPTPWEPGPPPKPLTAEQLAALAANMAQVTEAAKDRTKVWTVTDHYPTTFWGCLACGGLVWYAVGARTPAEAEQIHNRRRFYPAWAE